MENIAQEAAPAFGAAVWGPAVDYVTKNWRHVYLRADGKFGDKRRRGVVLLDAFTANAVATVYNALNEKNRAHMATLPIQKAAEISFKLLKSA